MAETQEEEDILLPHQEVLEELDIDLTSDLNQSFKMQIGKIEKNFQKAIEAEDEEAEEKVREQSKALANSIIKFMDDKKEASDLDERYNNLIEQADTEFQAEDYETARVTYNGALQLKPEETYPQNQLNLIEKAMLDSKSDAEQAEKYDSLVSLAQQKVKIMDFDAAKEALNQALELYPGDVPVTKALADIEAHLANPEGGAKPLSDNKQRVLDIISDLEATFKQNGKITHEDILDAGIEQYPSKEPQFQVGDPNKHGKALVLVKTADGEYTLKKKSNTGTKIAIGILGAGVIAAAVWWFLGRKKKG